ncbi:MAG: hypothetical protein NTU85_00060, partial [Candidatus Kaiserbacteria bacterium]|nr:hypothetical protein [Candidatus Kaiserbacteria bacterium]
ESSPISSSVPPMLQGNWHITDVNGNVIPHSLLYWTDKNNPQGSPPSNPSQDPQFTYLEYGISAWYSSHPNLFSESVMLPVPLSTVITTTQ